MRLWLALAAVVGLGGLAVVAGLRAQAPASAPRPATAADPKAFVNTYCIGCHNDKLRTSGLSLEKLDPSNPTADAEVWERVVGKLRSGSMPPAGMPRANPEVYRAVYTSLEGKLDQAWAANPNPGRIGSVHRLNRAEYGNAIRDLFGLKVDVAALLPGDDTADGSFDNFADTLSISTVHLERYMSVARQVSRLATGLAPARPGMESWEVPKFVVQKDRMSEDLPFGSRGGLSIPYNFVTDGEYLIRVRLKRQYQDYLQGMGWKQQVEIRLDGKLIKRFPVGGEGKGRAAAASYAGDGEVDFAGDPEWETYMQLTGDAGIEVRVPVQAGPRVVGVSFVREVFEPEGLPQRVQLGRVVSNDQIYMEYASVGSVQIGGPYGTKGPPKDTPSRRAIFSCYPTQVSQERDCANTILSRLARLAYRRPVTKLDLNTLMEFFENGRKDGGSFDEGIQFAIERMLVDPDFLLRVYKTPVARTPGGPTLQIKTSTAPKASVYKLNDIDLASRLAFFIWSSIPDDQLLTLAEKGELTKAAVLDKEIKRMLADPRAVDSLVNQFASQWLNLRQVVDVVIDPNKYPLYDESLLRAFQTETEMFVADNVQKDLPLKNLLDADYTFANERLAEHYKLPGIYGSRFRRVTLQDHQQRGGLLGMGSILVTTSYPDRTSPVLRGKWLLNNMFGLTIPPPPPGVNATLEAKAGTIIPGIRERLAMHRTSPTCNSCHSVIDPLGFALERFDVTGGWRTEDELGNPVDATATTAQGVKIDGLTGLRTLLLSDPEQFPRTVTEKLMAYALGRRLEYYDQPAVRKIVRSAAAQQYRWSGLIRGIAESPAFLTRAN
jgi:mono/diheme cytochrome c family protein